MASSKHYPHLERMISLLAQDNGTTMWLIREPNWFMVTDLPLLESQASQLNEYEKETLVAGEDTEQYELVEEKNVGELSDFIASVFDGELREVFFTRGG